ncbi:MAG: YlxM family DNA-binding protein [Chitinophagales bacterium]
MLGKFDRLIMLYDFYGPLLTERQRMAVGLYYEEDLSLAEVAEEMGITRQGVFDLLKRTEKALEAYEIKLGLVAKFEHQRDKVREAWTVLNQAEHQSFPDVKRLVVEILEEALEIEGSLERS